MKCLTITRVNNFHTKTTEYRFSSGMIVSVMDYVRAANRYNVQLDINYGGGYFDQQPSMTVTGNDKRKLIKELRHRLLMRTNPEYRATAIRLKI